MKSPIFMAAPALAALAAAACGANVGSETTGTGEQANTGCSAEWGQCGGIGWTGPSCCASGTTCTYSNAYYSQCLPSSSSSSSSSSSGSCPDGSNDAAQRAAASAAYSIMRASAIACAGNEGGSIGGPCWGDAILNSRRYALSGSTIVFNPDDPLYNYVPNAAKAALAIAQIDASTAEFLVQGLQWSQANTNGQVAVVALPTEALASFTYPGNGSPITVQDGNAGNDRRQEVVTGSAWCNTEDIHFVDTSSDETGFAPFNLIPATNMSEPGGNAPGFTGGNSWPSTPFNGPAGGSNPYLIVGLSVNGSVQAVNWNSTSFPTESCSGTQICSGTIDVDPIPYTQPAPYYNANGLVGPESNPFTLVVADEWADSANAGNWATEIVGGVQHGGTFSNGATYFGITVYGFVEQY
jgi:hypothetical protein